MSVKYQGIRKNTAGKVYFINEERMGKGGEGSIHSLENDDRYVAKIFKADKRTEEREEKLLHMVDFPVDPESLSQIAWPQDVLYDERKRFVGYVMPKVRHTDSLIQIYSEEKFNLKERLLTAINLCAAIDTVHSMGQVCGDLNPQNICVNLDRRDKKCFQVTLVDSDSYHFVTPEKTYRCEVGLADYLAPEIQKKLSSGENLKTAPLPTFTKETDLFALAVHIFCLLMNGCHPFACAKKMDGKYTGGDDGTIGRMDSHGAKPSEVTPQPIENIKTGFFPFYDSSETLRYPLYAPSLDSLPEKIKELFIQTFKKGYRMPSKRVTAQEWMEALGNEKNEITDAGCKRPLGKKHFYFSHVAECPFCEAEDKMISLLKPVSDLQPDIPDFDTDSNFVKPSEPSSEHVPYLSRIAVGIIIGLAAVVVLLIILSPFLMTNQTEQSYIYETSSEQSETNSDKKQYILSFSDSRYVTIDDLKKLTKWQCKLARNEIYARHGRKFKNKKIQKYFDSQSWYVGYIEQDEFDKNELNGYEKKNVRTIFEYESRS